MSNPGDTYNVATGPAGNTDVPVSFDMPAKDQPNVESICQDVIKRTDKLVHDKVERILTDAAGQLQTSFDRQQEQLNCSVEEELRCCREKVKTLEADKEQMQKTVQKLQEQMNGLLTLLYANPQFGWPGQGLLGVPNQGQVPDGSRVNAGMMGQFATFPSGLPVFPMFPNMGRDSPLFAPPVAPDASEASQDSTTAPPSPPQITPSTSAPPTPSRAPISPPAAAPPPPPGLESELPSAAFASGAPFLAAPPGLTGSPRAKASAPISILAALDQKATPECDEKAHQEQARAREDPHSEALKMMMKADKGDFLDGVDSSRLQPQSPVPASPGMSGSARLLASPSQTLNITPKRKQRLSNGRLSTPGLKSPAVPASPFVICESGGSIFGFTLRKADDCTLGLEVDHTDTGNYLKVTGVNPGGAMQAWNKQCIGGPSAGKAVAPGDKIVKVNNATTPMAMLEECRVQKLLRFTVQRGEVDDDFDPLSLSSWGVSSSS